MNRSTRKLFLAIFLVVSLFGTLTAVWADDLATTQNAALQAVQPNQEVTYDMQTGAVTVAERTPSASKISHLEGNVGAQPYGEPAGSLRNVIGQDERARVSGVYNYPYSAVTKLSIIYPNGQRRICTGAMVSEFHVMTAAHCVYSHTSGGYANMVEVMPGQDDHYYPYSSANTTKIRMFSEWISDQDVSHDWAILTLDRNVGAQTGWFGLYTSDAPEWNPIYTDAASLPGYPADLNGSCCMYESADYGHSADYARHYYLNDATPGQDGAPVYRYLNGSDGLGLYILSVHTDGFDSSDAIQANSGTRLTWWKLESFNNWKSEDTPPTDYPDMIDYGVDYASFSPGTIQSGEMLTITNHVLNIGTQATGSYVVTYYASDNPDVNNFDYYIGQTSMNSLAPFHWDTSQLVVPFPSNIPNGSYYIGWVIDVQNHVTEFDEGNNGAYFQSPLLTVGTQYPPEAATLIGDDGSYLSHTPTYSWNVVANSTWYYLLLRDTYGNQYSKWFTAAEACSGSTCSVSPTTLPPGQYSWTVQTWNEAGTGPTSDPLTFSIITVGRPGTASPISPTGEIGETEVIFQWSRVTDATTYQLLIYDANRQVSSQTYNTWAVCPVTVEDSICQTRITLAAGAYSWSVRTSNNNEQGYESEQISFTVDDGSIPTAVQLSSWELSTGGSGIASNGVALVGLLIGTRFALRKKLRPSISVYLDLSYKKMSGAKKSFHANWKVKMATVAIAGRASGRTTYQMIWGIPAPSIRAAFSRSGGICIKN